MIRLCLPPPAPVEEASPEEMAIMELKGALRQTDGGWSCECDGTQAGYGHTPEAAYRAWQRSLCQPETFPDDAYDMLERDYLRLLNDL